MREDVAASMTYDAACGAYASWMPRHPIKIFYARMMNVVACDIECRGIGPVTQKKIKSFILYRLLTQF